MPDKRDYQTRDRKEIEWIVWELDGRMLIPYDYAAVDGSLERDLPTLKVRQPRVRP